MNDLDIKDIIDIEVSLLAYTILFSSKMHFLNGLEILIYFLIL